MSFASSSEKSDIELSDDEDRSSSPPATSLRASSVAYFFTYSETFFLYSSGLNRIQSSLESDNRKLNYQWSTCEDTWRQHRHSKDLWGWGMLTAGVRKTRKCLRDHREQSRLGWSRPDTLSRTPRQCWDDKPEKQEKLGGIKEQFSFSSSEFNLTQLSVDDCIFWHLLNCNFHDLIINPVQCINWSWP